MAGKTKELIDNIEAGFVQMADENSSVLKHGTEANDSLCHQSVADELVNNIVTLEKSTEVVIGETNSSITEDKKKEHAEKIAKIIAFLKEGAPGEDEEIHKLNSNIVPENDQILDSTHQQIVLENNSEISVNVTSLSDPTDNERLQQALTSSETSLQIYANSTCESTNDVELIFDNSPSISTEITLISKHTKSNDMKNVTRLIAAKRKMQNLFELKEKKQRSEFVRKDELFSAVLPSNPLEKYSHSEFREKFRVSKEVVMQYLLPILLTQLSSLTHRGFPISPIIKILITLRFYATGSLKLVLLEIPGDYVSFICDIIEHVSKAICSLSTLYVKFTDFSMELPDLPGVIGVLGNTSIKFFDLVVIYGKDRILHPPLKVQIVTNTKSEIINIYMNNTSQISKNDLFLKSGLSEQLTLGSIPGILVADNSHPCYPYLLTPHPNATLPSELSFNEALDKSISIVDNLISSWQERFPCLKCGFQFGVNTAKSMVASMAILWNLCIRLDDAWNIEQRVREQSDVTNDNSYGFDFRKFFIEFYFSEK